MTDFASGRGGAVLLLRCEGDEEGSLPYPMQEYLSRLTAHIAVLQHHHGLGAEWTRTLEDAHQVDFDVTPMMRMINRLEVLTRAYAEQHHDTVTEHRDGRERTFLRVPATPGADAAWPEHDAPGDGLGPR